MCHDSVNGHREPARTLGEGKAKFVATLYATPRRYDSSMTATDERALILALGRSSMPWSRRASGAEPRQGSPSRCKVNR